ncbi:MAG TPA: hypothetical protein VJT73_02270 [Polyangiaceae bacterium]|nr:hypothetical protein [Polyangiaceae bacterium]
MHGRHLKVLRSLLELVGWVIVVVALRVTAKSWFDDFTRWGWHDWDSSTTSRWLSVHTIKTYHQFPFWNPYTCGGYTTWGYVDADTTVISPWLPLYLLAPMSIALRVEVLGTCLIGALGAWLLASHHTKSISARAFAAIVFALNGRFALQAAAGHLWHSYYAYMPWALYFYGRALGNGRGPARWTDAVWSGFFVALMVYSGALYPLPHTVLAIALLGVLTAYFRRSLEPVRQGMIVAAAALGLAAPKLFPISEFFSRTPRFFDSLETMGLDTFVATLTSKDQDFSSRPAPTSQWGWHEWGMYIGWVPLAIIVLSILYVRDKEMRPFKIVGLFFLVLGFGAFHPNAPWSLMHRLPVFSSQHVPSRWMYPAILLLAVVAAVGIGRILGRFGAWASLAIDAAFMAVVAFIAMDIAPVAALPMQRVFWMELPPLHVEKEFHQEATVSPTLRYVVSDWATPALPAMMSNIGVLECYGVAGLSVWSREADGHIPGLGAKGRGDPAYRGEVHTESGAGKATIASFSPNEIVVEVEDGKPGDVLVLNQNYYSGWRVNGDPVFNHGDAVGTRLKGGNERLRFVCGASRLGSGLIVFAATLGAIAFRALRSRRLASSRAALAT